jgi:heme o synthase
MPVHSSASIITQSLPLRAPLAKPATKSWTSVLCDLVKVRLTSLVLLTTLTGFYMGTQGAVDYGLMLQALLGTALVACGASALNQLLEREYDARMHRTQDRPLPSHRMKPMAVFLFGVLCSLLGLVQLAWAVNWLTCLLGATTLAIYLCVYTSLKRVTWLNTVVGAIPGALPPLIGWTAARNSLDIEGLSLFGILFFWQISHFLAIAWLYRDEYAKAGFVMLSVVDTQGKRTGRIAVLHTLGLFGVSLVPVVLGLAGQVYLVAGLVLGLLFVWFSLQFALKMSLPTARHAFYASILYLPMLLLIISLDKVKT